MTAISTTSLVAALGAFFRANKNILIRDMYMGLDTEDWTVMDGVSDELPLPKLTTAKIVKPADNSNFTPTANAIALGARILKVRKWKVDLLIDPSSLINTWLGFTKKPGTRQTVVPLEVFVMEGIIKQIQQDIRMDALYKGVYNGAGTTPTDILNGYLKLIVDEITAGNLTPIVTGAITSANVVDKLLLVHDGLDPAWKNTETICPVNSQIFDWYARKFSPVLNTQLMGTSLSAPTGAGLIDKLRLEGTNTFIKREPGLGTSQRISITPVANRILGMDTAADFNNFEFQRFDRSIKVLGDGALGVQIAQSDDKAIRVNDQV